MMLPPLRKARRVHNMLCIAFLATLVAASLVCAEDPPDFVTEWGIQGAAAGEFDHPADMVLDSHNRLVFADTRNYRIQRFDRDGNYLDGWGRRGTGPGEFLAPLAVAFAPNDDVFVVDTANNRVTRFNDSGEFLYM